jgi:hypothetical protein
MTKPLHINLPAPRVERIKQLAAEQGMTTTAFMARLATMYMRRPEAFEKLFHELDPKKGKEKDGPNL